MKKYPVVIEGDRYWTTYSHIAVRDDGEIIIVTTRCKLVFSKKAVTYKNNQGLPRYTIFTVQDFINEYEVKMFGNDYVDDKVSAVRFGNGRGVKLYSLMDGVLRGMECKSDTYIMQYDIGVVKANKLFRTACKDPEFTKDLDNSGSGKAIIKGKEYNFVCNKGEFWIMLDYNGRHVNTPKYKIMPKKMYNKYGEVYHPDDIVIPSWGLT